MSVDCDLLIVGGGPAGLSTAINGASEGLRVCLIDSGTTLGGGARESNAIENYPGFPEGVTGDELMSRMVMQADKFKTDIFAPLQAAKLKVDGDSRVVITDDYQEFRAKSVILSLGLNYRRLNVPNIGQLMGRGVYYGLPSFIKCSGCKIGIVGGANSAAQAALHLAKEPNSEVTMFVRNKIETQMSMYLIERINASKNIKVLNNSEVAMVHGDGGKLQSVDITIGGDKPLDHSRMELDFLFIFIGAMPKTLWLDGTVQLSKKNFILTGINVKEETEYAGLNGERVGPRYIPMPFETSIPGVFAAGDVREGSTKRIAAAIGEGSAALAMCHQYLNNLGAKT